MSRIIPTVNTADDSFGDVFTAVSNIASAFTETITVKANTVGDSTSGNGFVLGTLGATTLTANTLRGGNVAAAANLTVTSNLTVSGTTLIITSNASFEAANVTVGNSTVTHISVVNDGTTANVTVGGNNATVTANLSITGRSFRIPSGNTGTRPTGVDGLLRHNTDTNLLEMYSSGGWKNFISYANTFSASDVSFDPEGNISAVTIQTAIEELDTEKLALTGGTMTGNVVMNRNGLTLPTAANGAMIQLGQLDGAAAVIDVSSFANSAGIIARRAGGINSSKTALAAGDVIMKISGRGYDGNSYSTTDRAAVELRAAQNWANTAHGTRVVVVATANGFLNPIDALIVSPNGSVVNSALTVTGAASFSNDVTITGGATIGGTVTVKDGMFIITDDDDDTKKAMFQASGISSGTTRTYTLPNSNGTIALTTPANTTVAGLSEIATGTEFTAGTDTLRVLGVAETWGAASEKTLTDAANIAISFTSGINFTVTLEGNRILSNPAGTDKAQSGYIRVVQDGTGSRTLGYDTSWEFAAGTPVILSTAPGAEDMLFYQVISSTRVLLAAVKDIR